MDMAQRLLNDLNAAASKARQAENLGRSERTCNKYWNKYFVCEDAYNKFIKAGS